MKLFSSLKYLNEKSEESKEARRITDKLPSNDIMARDMLKSVNNHTTNVVLDNDIKNSYYVYLKDTIYISNKKKNNNFHRCCLVAHECIHSIQSKLVQKINFIISNIELLSFIVCLILSIILRNNIITFVYSGIAILSILPRLYLEIDAIKKSVGLSKEYMRTILNKEETECIGNIYKGQIKILLPFALISLFFEKFIRFIIIFVINYLF